ncbi:SseB family protein [Plantibacter sp. Mn2098]|uniref:SseB family protein n=1 Tax=Plantibacter sp. Mn2098 TaxID=3395266 RepID=UPI003BE8C640
MGLFSKRNSSDADAADGADDLTAAGAASGAEGADGADGAAAASPKAADATAASDAPEGSDANEAPVPHVSISVTGVSTPFGGPAPALAQPEAAEAAEEEQARADAPEENVDLGQALASLPEAEDQRGMLHVLRQSLQGKLLLSTNAEGISPESQAEGRVPLGVYRDDEGAVFLLAYTSSLDLEHARSEGETLYGVSVPALWALEQATSDAYAGIVLNPASEGMSAVIPKELVKRMLGDGRNNNAAKQALSQPRLVDAEERVVAALAEFGCFVAGRADVDENGVRTAVGIAESRMGDRRLLEVFTSPLEIAALGRGDDAYPLTSEELAKALLSDEDLAGIIVNPAAPWLDLDRSQLTALLAKG